MIRESVYQCGQERNLVGVLTEPGSDGGGDRPVLLFLNAGYVHRPGPHRLHVILGRALAEKGYPSFRFDFSGIGDSPARRAEDGWSPERLAVQETLDVLDFLEREKGIKRFVLTGICSGAYVAFFAACLDSRVTSIVPINMPLDLFTPDRHEIGRFDRRSKRRQIFREMIFSPWHWGRLLRKVMASCRFPGVQRVREGEGSGEPWVPSDRIGTGPVGFDAGLAELERRETPMLLIFCKGEKGYDYIKRDRQDILGPHVEIRHYAEVDHTFSQQRFRDSLLSELLVWLESGN